jgi:hypothetical protein
MIIVIDLLGQQNDVIVYVGNNLIVDLKVQCSPNSSLKKKIIMYCIHLSKFLGNPEDYNAPVCML